MDRSFKTGSRTAPRLALAITTAIAGLTLAGMAANAAPRAEVSFANAQTALSKGQINKAIQHAEAAVLADPADARMVPPRSAAKGFRMGKFPTNAGGIASIGPLVDLM